MFGSGKGPSPVEDRTSPMSPQLALRVTVVGGIALVLFGLIFFRLWYLQVLDSNQYAKAAGSNVTRRIAVQSPRGSILGLDGSPLVESQSVPAVSISPTDLPQRLTLGGLSSTTTILSGKNKGLPKYLLGQPAPDRALYRRLAPILGVSNKPGNCAVTVYYTGKVITYSYKLGTAPRMTPIECEVAKGVAQSQYADVTVKSGVSADVRSYIDERQTNFQGVIAGQATEQNYLLGEAGAQVFGYSSPIQSDETKDPNFKGASQIDDVGQTGLEYEYDKYLRGTDGYQSVKVNAANEFEGYGKGSAGRAGNNLKTSLDPSLEKVGYSALAHSISVNCATCGISDAAATDGAFVAMDPTNGKVYAMGSYPSYKPSIFAHGLSEKELKFLDAPANHDPLLNYAIQGVGPDGSTFKVITATAALQSGVWAPQESWVDPNYFCLPGYSPSQVNYDNGACRHNSSGDTGGTFDLETAFEVSDDDFFFHLGYLLRFNPATNPNGGALEQWAHKYGVGRATGVDLPDESVGTDPSPKLFTDLDRDQVECQKHQGAYKHHTGPCQIADGATWGPGDDLNTALGQGEVQLTPLQLAVIYSAVENGGTIVTPHLAEDEQTPSGQVVQRFSFPAKRHLNIDPTNLAAIQQGLKLAANGASGTSSDVMGNFGLKVYGKTGTAQQGSTTVTAAGGGKDSAWYACYVPGSETRKPIVVVVWVQNGGFGDIAGAPVARQILSQWFYNHPGSYDIGHNTDT
jgi:penicillin-binding protein 2